MSDQREQKRHLTTTDAGSPAPSDEYSLTVGPGGPNLLQDRYLTEKLAHFVRERIPDRVYHVKGGGAFGYFEVIADVTQWTKAAFLNNVGKRTPLFLRFSIVAADEGAPDTDRDVRGVAVKFYTEEGNYDIVGNNTPVFFVRDPMKFPDFIHSQLRLPDTGIRSNNMQWDFWTLSPESAHQVTYLMGDRGTPRTWRHMNAYSSSTFMWENAAGKKFWVKYHFKSEQGVENFTDAEAKAMFVKDLDYHRRDMWDAIARKDFPAWRLEMQIMPYEDAANYRFNPFDLTKVWPHKDYPPITVGRLVLDRNPANHFAEVEQAAFSPSNLVPGIGLSPDKMLMGRIFSYHDTHLHRIGANYEHLPINAPKSPVHSYSKDGPMTYRHAGSQPVYAPNSYGGPKADPRTEPPTWLVEGGEIGRYAYDLHAQDDDFGQPGALVREVMNDAERERLAASIIGHANNGVSTPVLERVIEYWASVDPQLGARVAAGVGMAGMNGRSLTTTERQVA